jgi:hypothetical protein
MFVGYWIFDFRTDLEDLPLSCCNDYMQAC